MPHCLVRRVQSRWWLQGSSGYIVNLCSHIPEMDQREYVIPMADIVHSSPDALRYHIRALYTFRVQNSYCQSSGGDLYIEGVLLPK